MTECLSKDDVSRLLHDRSDESRVETARKLAAQFSTDGLKSDERQIAEDILRLLAKDVATKVREALSSNLKECVNTPKDLALALANDVDTVALPMIEFSGALSDDDLMQIVRGQSTEKQIAVSRRETVSEQVSDALIDTGNEQVVASLVANNGAEVSETSMQRILDDHGDSEMVQGSMVHREKLPVTVAERLVIMVTDTLQQHLMANHELSPDVATDMLLKARERATIDLLKGEATDEDTMKLVAQLSENGRLTPSIILRALCMGDLLFFEASLAQRAGVPFAEVQKLVHDNGASALKSVFTAARLPDALFPTVHVAVNIAHENNYGGGTDGRESYCRMILDQILTGYHEIDPADLEYLQARLERLVKVAA